MSSEAHPMQSEDVEHRVQELNRESAELGSRRQYSEAIKIAQLARELSLKYLGDTDLFFTVSVDHLARFSSKLGRYPDAIRFYTEEVERFRSLGVLDPSTPAEPLIRFVQVLGNRGDLKRLVDDLSDAEVDLKEALDLCESRALKKSVLEDTLTDWGILKKAKGEYLEAERVYDHLLSVQRAAYPNGDRRLARTLVNLAALYQELHRYAGAKELYQEALDLYKRLVPENDPAIGRTLNGLAGVCHSAGDYRHASALFRQSRDILRNEPADYAEVTDNFAELCRRLGDYRLARRLFIESLLIRKKSIGKTSRPYAKGLDNLATLYYSMHRLSKAENLQARAGNILSKLGRTHVDVAINLSNRSTTLVAMARYGEAAPMLEHAVRVYRSVGREQDHDLGVALNNLGALYRDIGDYTSAERCLNEAVKVQSAAVGKGHPSYATVLINLARLFVTTGNAEKSLGLLAEAANIEDRSALQFLGIGSEEQRIQYLSTLRGNLDGFLSLAVDVLPESTEAATAAFTLALRRKTASTDISRIQKEWALSGDYPDLEPTLRALLDLRTQIAETSIAGPGASDLAEHRGKLAELQQQKEDLETQLSQQIPEIALEQSVKGATSEAVARALPEDAVLVEFVRTRAFNFKATPHDGSAWGEVRYVAFLVTANTMLMADLGSATRIERLVARLRRSIRPPFIALRDLKVQKGQQTARNIEKTKHGLSGALHELRLRTSDWLASSRKGLATILFPDLFRTAIGNRNRLILAPDGDLTRLPFEILRFNRRSLIDTYEITYLSVGRDILRPRDSKSATTSAPVVFADPDFSLGSERPDSSPIVRQLPNTKPEGEDVARLLGVSPRLGDEAVENRLKACRSPFILHIATHGFFLPDEAGISSNTSDRLFGQRLTNPLLRSGLFLAGANSYLRGSTHLPLEVGDGVLTAEEITTLDLRNTQLVVLSACETGLGEIRSGEGVFGLRRAFAIAGAKTLIMSLWAVPDKQTRELMVEFYGFILSGRGRADALRCAQLALRQKYRNPWYWGAFICQGDSAPIPSWPK